MPLGPSQKRNPVGERRYKRNGICQVITLAVVIAQAAVEGPEIIGHATTNRQAEDQFQDELEGNILGAISIRDNDYTFLDRRKNEIFSKKMDLGLRFCDKFL